MNQNLKLVLFLTYFICVSAEILFCQSLNTFNPDSSRFSLKEINGNWWLIHPQGKAFFSRGVCCVNTGLSFDEYDETNPGYSAWQHFKNPLQWAQNTVDSLTSWGYTTIGGWSSIDHFLRLPELKMYFTPVLAIGASAGAPWFDMWDSTVINRMDETAKKIIPEIKDSPNLIGYYTDNELGWWNAALWNITLKDSSSIARKKTIDLVYDYYEGNWANLLKDFDPVGANNFNELKDSGHLYLRPGGNGIILIKRFVALLAERYYALVTEMIRKYDKKALILGDRYQSFYYNEVAKASSKFVDVISTNLNASWNDGSITRFYLSNLYELTRKPIAIGEYYMAAHENRSGNKNSSATFPTVEKQQQRVNGFLRTSGIIAQTPCIVMADWFQFYDEPTHGRFDGENYNMGLIDIHGKPYEELVSAARNFKWEEYKSNPQNKLPDASAGIPPAPGDHVIIPEDKGIIKNWDRTNGFVKPVTELPSADMYLCWNEDTLFVAVYGIDVVEKEFYKENIIPEEDRMELVLNIDRSLSVIKMRLGAGRKPVCNDKRIAIFNSSGVFLQVINITVLKIPAKLFGKSDLKAGDKVKFSMILTTFARTAMTKWEVDYHLSKK